MAKFALMAQNGDKHLQEFEGEFLEVNGDNVLVMGNDKQGNWRALNVVKLSPGYVVKKIEAGR